MERNYVLEYIVWNQRLTNSQPTNDWIVKLKQGNMVKHTINALEIIIN